MSETKDSTSENNEIPEIIELLISYINSSNYITTIQSFFSTYSSDFITYSSRIETGEGNKIEWMEIYQQYIELIEQQLETFCQENSITTIELFNIIQNYILRNKNEIEFIPLFLKTTDENYFFEQMYSYAIEKTLIRNVNEKSENEGKGEESMTGKLLFFFFLYLSRFDSDF